jgi:hypothetical protein
MSERLIGYDNAELEPGIIEETDTEIVVSAIIAREIVQKYPDGIFYKSADELEKAAWTAEGRWVTTDAHPPSKLILRPSEIKGRIENYQFVRNLIDPKTKRPMDRGIKADLRFYKPKLKPEFLADLKAGKKQEVSIGFTYDEDRVPGEWRGEKYDGQQKNLFIDHVAAGVLKGRCPAPYCGIGVDSMIFKIAADPWEEGEKYIRSGHRDPENFDPNSMRTIDITEGIKAVVGCPRGKYADGKCTVGTEVQSFLFDIGKFSIEQAKAWFDKHRGDSVDAVGDCPICVAIESIGVLEASKRLASAFGTDAVDAIKMDEAQLAAHRARKKKDAEIKSGQDTEDARKAEIERSRRLVDEVNRIMVNSLTEVPRDDGASGPGSPD